MAWLLYQALTVLLLAVAAPVLLVRRGSHYLPTLPGRWGRHPPVSPARRLWIHAVSVGEVGVAATLVSALPDGISIVVTTTTPTGQAVARRTLSPRCDVTYFPFDLAGPVARLYRTFDPAALVLVEGDYWPLVLREARRRRLPVAVVNGRVSDRSARRQRLFRPLLGPLYDPIDLFAVQGEQDRARLLELGAAADRIYVTGNLKFDTAEPAPLPELEDRLRRLAAGRTILVAGSTMPGEEAQVLRALQALGPERALLVLAPRHPERCDAVASELSAAGLRWCRRSALDGETDDVDPPQVVLLDTLGELAALYRAAGAAFVGGTLVSTGGHNPLEAARFAIPVAAGPSMSNFPEIADLLDRRRAWRRVADADQLAGAWRDWLDDPEEARDLGARAAEVVAENRGATRRTLELLAPLLREAGL